MDNDDDNLTKIYVDLPDHWATSGESMWAKALGDDLYEVENVPFHTYGLNWKDVVRAVPPDEHSKPRVVEVVRHGGHQTLRFFFSGDLAEEAQQPYLALIRELGSDIERADERLVAVDVPPDGQYQATCDLLARLEAEGVLEYETCEMRVPGRFDLDGSSDDAPN
jgi:hypothetical protein